MSPLWHVDAEFWASRAAACSIAGTAEDVDARMRSPGGSSVDKAPARWEEAT